jgi:alpha-glucosidase
LPSAALADQWQAFLAAIPWQIALQQFNLLGSHDTPRVLTAVKNNPDLAKVAAAILLTFPGVPCIYYGDEIGMEGGADPDNRRPMVWEPAGWNSALREFYRQLIRLRKELAVLQVGGFQILYAEGETIAYQRELPGERLIVVARRAADGLAALPLTGAGLSPATTFRELLTGQAGIHSDDHLLLEGLPDTGVQIWYSGV